MGLVALALQCGFHFRTQHGRKGAPPYPIDRRLMSLAAKAPRRSLRAAKDKNRSFYRANNGELSRHADFLRHNLCLFKRIN